MQAIVLSRRDWRENDQLITLYTLERGKIVVLARGVKKILSKNSAALEPFCFVEADVIPGKEIFHLGSVTVLSLFKNIRADFGKSMTAGYAVGLLDKIIQTESPDKKIFNLLQSWLGFLDQNGRGVEPFNFLLLADVFVVKLFYFLGFDITVARGSLKIKSILKFVLGAKWEDINSLKLDKNLGVLVHEAVYAFSVYHSECKIADWKKLAKIGQI